MKTFFSDLFPKIQRYSDKLDNLTMLTNQHWVSIDDIQLTKTVYIFRINNELLISKDGKVEKARWEYLGNKSLLIDKFDNSYLFKHGFFDENILALKVDGSDEYAVFVNENKYEGELNSIEKVNDFLRKSYINPSIKSTIETSTGQELTYSTNSEIIYKETLDNITLKIVTSNKKAIGSKVYIDDLPAKDGIYIYKSLYLKLIVKEGEIVERYYLEKVKDYIFEKGNNSEPKAGDKIYSLDWNLLLNGEYRYSLFKHYIVVNGKII